MAAAHVGPRIETGAAGESVVMRSGYSASKAKVIIVRVISI